MAKPTGWWTTHPTLLTMSVLGADDASGDGLGDFEGVRRRLGTFREAGISGLRFQHVGAYGDDPMWSGLVQQDWFSVDPRYGTMSDFERLMGECREKDVAVIMMAVPEYLGWSHPDFLAAQKARSTGAADPRVSWFEWKDDGSVFTCWDRPAPDVSNASYMDAFLRHIEYWMERGIRGWDTDAVGTWHHLDEEVLRRFTSFVIARGGFVTAENMVLEQEVAKRGGFNAGTGFLRHEFYNELKAITEHRADWIRGGLSRRDKLIRLGMFPYQQFGDQSYAVLTGGWYSHIHEMFKLQAAFNAVLPDQVWILADALTFSNPARPPDPGRSGRHFGTVDWGALCQQEQDPQSVYSHVRRLFRLRAEHKELGIGNIHEVPTNHQQDMFAAIRTSEDREKQALVVFNFSESYRDVTLSLGRSSPVLRNYLSGETVAPSRGRVSVRLFPYGFAFFSME